MASSDHPGEESDCVRVREATVGDAVVMAQLGASIQQMHHDHRPDWFKPASAHEVVALYEELLANHAATAFLAADGHDVLGFVVVKVLRKPDSPLRWAQAIVDIDQIGVAPSARRRGVGHELIRAVRELAD